MHVQCSNCKSDVAVALDEPLEDVSCPSCGFRLNFAATREATVTWRPADGPTEIGHFQLLALWVAGIPGEVWKARDTKLGRFVALKIPRPDHFNDSSLRVFQREAEAAARLKHPHIVTVYEIGRAADTVYIASELIDGVDLAQWMARKRPKPREAVELCIALAEALHHAHQAGIVHRDLKPGNVLIDSQGRPHIADFGLAKRTGADLTLTMPGHILGTAAYMSPEQAAGHGHEADRRSDVYSLGVILYELLTGRRPFQGAFRLVLYQVLHDEPKRPRRLASGVPLDLETICLKAMAKEPSQRYATAAEMADDLGRFLRHEPIRARRIGPLGRVWRWCRRNRGMAVAGGVAVAAVSVLMLSLLRSPSPAAKVLRTVRLDTHPPGATIVFHPLDGMTGEPCAERAVRAGVSPVEAELEPADYLVVAVLNNDGYAFHEVYRRVPPPGAGAPGFYSHLRWDVGPDEGVTLPPIAIPKDTVTEKMALFRRAEEFTVGSESQADVPPHVRSVPAFWLEPTEVRVKDLRSRWPRSVQFQYYYPTPPADDDALAYISYDEAVQYAESIGKRLPTEWEYEFAATDGGTRILPAIPKWAYDAVGSANWDRVRAGRSVFGLYSNVAEWTCSWPVPDPKLWEAGLRTPGAPDTRIVRGGPLSVIERRPKPGEQFPGPRGRALMPRNSWTPGLGFRCARSASPPFEPDHFSRLKAE